MHNKGIESSALTTLSGYSGERKQGVMATGGVNMIQEDDNMCYIYITVCIGGHSGPASHDTCQLSSRLFGC